MPLPIQRRDVASALIFNPRLSPLELIRCYRRFRAPFTSKAKDEIIHVLNAFLLQRHQSGLTTLVVVDEAQHLSPKLLEEIRLLTNLETGGKSYSKSFWRASRNLIRS